MTFSKKTLIALGIFSLALSTPTLKAKGAEAPPNGRLEDAEALTRSFKAFCPSHGVWVDRARETARSLSQQIKLIREDDACRSLAGALGDLDSLQHILSRESFLESDEEIQGLENNRYEVLQELGRVRNFETRRDLEFYLKMTQVRLDSLEGAGARKARRNQSIVKSVAVAKTLMAQALLQKECLVQKPQLLADLAALSGSIGAVAVTGGVSLGLAAGLELLSSTVEYVRKAQLQNSLQRVGEASIHESFSCVLEAMSNQWCSARETVSLLDLRRDSRMTNTPLYQGIGLLNREMPVLIEWLEMVNAGARPNNEAEANRKKIIYAKEAALKAFVPTALAVLSEQKRLLPPGSTTDELRVRFDLMRHAIIQISEAAVSGGSVAGVSAGNPINDAFRAEEIPWILAGLDEAPFDEDDGRRQVKDFSSEPFQSFRDGDIPGIVYPFDPTIIQNRIAYLSQKGEARLALERSKILHSDPRAILWDAETPVYRGKSRGLTPLDSLQKIRVFLDESGLSGAELSAQQRYLIRDTIARLDKIHKIVTDSLYVDSRRPRPFEESEGGDSGEDNGGDDGGEDVVNPPPPPAPPENEFEDEVAQKALDEIFLTTPNGAGFFAERLQRVFRLEFHRWILDRSKNNLRPDMSAQLIASEDILEELTRLGSNSLALVRSDVTKALVNSSTTHQAFSDLFADQLDRTLRFYGRKAKEQPSLHEVSLADFCLLLLSVPNLKTRSLSKLPLEICEGRVRRSEHPKGEGSVKITRSMYFTEFESGRACHFRNFMRQERILDQFEILKKDPLIKSLQN